MYVSRTVFSAVSKVSWFVEITLSPALIFSMATIPATAMTRVPATKHDGLNPALFAALLKPLFIPPVNTATPAMVVCAKLYTELLCNVALKSLSQLSPNRIFDSMGIILML